MMERVKDNRVSVPVLRFVEASVISFDSSGFRCMCPEKSILTDMTLHVVADSLLDKLIRQLLLVQVVVEQSLHRECLYCNLKMADGIFSTPILLKANNNCHTRTHLRVVGGTLSTKSP